MDGGLFMDSAESSLKDENTTSNHDSFLPWLEEDETLGAYICNHSPDPSDDHDAMEDADIKEIIGLGLNSRYSKNEMVPVEI